MTPATTETAPGLDEYIRDHRGWPVLGTALLAPVVALTILDPAGLSETWHLVLPAVAAVVLYRSSTMRWGLGGSALAGAGGALLCVLVGLLVYSVGWIPVGWGSGGEVLPFALSVVPAVALTVAVAGVRRTLRYRP